MPTYDMKELLQHRKEMAMTVCGIFDEEEIGSVEPISYLEPTQEHTFVTVWLFGNKKIYSAMTELIPGDWDSPAASRCEILRCISIKEY